MPPGFAREVFFQKHDIFAFSRVYILKGGEEI